MGKLVNINFDETNPASEDAIFGTITVVLPLNVCARTSEELTRDLVEVRTGGIREACRQHDVRVRGFVPSASGEGEGIAVDLPVEDADTFTPDGLTRSCTELRRLFVRHYVAERLGRAGLDVLTPGQREKLERYREVYRGAHQRKEN